LQLYIIYQYVPAGQNVTGGTVRVSIKYMSIIPVVNKQFQLCNLAISVLKTCPLEAGVHEATLVESLPSYTPSVSLSHAHLTKCCTVWTFKVAFLMDISILVFTFYRKDSEGS